jgi:lycopene cyclase domain-containing protein
VVALLWDVAAIYLDIWQWPADCCVLPRIGKLPLEELLFFILFSLYAAMITLILRDKYNKQQYKK